MVSARPSHSMFQLPEMLYIFVGYRTPNPTLSYVLDERIRTRMHARTAALVIMWLKKDGLFF